MGVLDEAIREHLELKRRHGASQDELARAEAEALGPARREVAGPPADHAGLEAGAGGSGEAATELLEPPPDLAQPAAAVDEHAPAVDEHAPPIEPPPPPVEPRPSVEAELPSDEYEEEEPWSAPTSASTSTPVPEIPEEAELEPGHPFEPEPELGAGPGIDTEEHAVESHEPYEPEPHQPVEATDEEPGLEDEDVLEETPEFLQETPEHDRLWFEQKPPRDFDFDD
jgi:hypothetical protein